MPRTSGTYTLPPVYLGVSGQKIRTEQHNTPLEDVAAALTNSLPRDGQAAMTGNLPMGGNKITGLGLGTAPEDAARISQAADPNRTPYKDQINTFSQAQTFSGPTNIKAKFGGSETGVIHFTDASNPVGYLIWDATRMMFQVGTKNFWMRANGTMEVDGGTVYHTNNNPTPAQVGAVAASFRELNSMTFARNTTLNDLPANGNILAGNLREVSVSTTGALVDSAQPGAGYWKALTACPAGRATIFVKIS